MHRIVLAAVVFLALIEPIAAAAQATQPAYTHRQDVIYGRTYGTALTMDVFQPSGRQNGAIVVFVCSGGYISNPDSIRLPLINIFVRPFLDRGYVVCAVVHGSQPKFTIPEAAANINRAVQYIRAQAREARLDGERIGIYGGSAGGHLSLLQATKPAAGNPRSADPVERVSGKVQAVACFYPPTDFLNWGAPNKLVTESPLIEPYLAAFDFREIADRRLVPVSEKRKLEILRELSPIYHVTADAPPILVIHGDADKLVPIQQATTFVEKLKHVGVKSELVVKQEDGHGWVTLEPDIQKMVDWFDVHLAGHADKSATQSATAPSRSDPSRAD